MTNLAGWILFIPGALEVVLFVLVMIGLIVFHRGFNTRLIPQSLFIAFILRFLFQIGADLVRESWNPWLLILLALLAVLCWALSKMSSKGAHWGAILAVLVLYLGAYQTFTFVKKTKVENVIWEIDESTQSNFKQETVIHFQYENYPNHGFAIANSAIANLLRAQGGSHATVEIEGLYHWGNFAGSSVNKINQIPVPLGTQVSEGCGEDCSNPPFRNYILF